MLIPDVNILIYAYDSTSPRHAEARRWWERTLAGDRPVGLDQVSFSRFDANTANFSRRSAADHSHETLFQCPASYGQLTHYVGYVNAFLSAVANQLNI